MKTYEDYENVLARNWGSDAYYRYHPMFVLTTGAKDLCETMECFWIADIVWSYIPDVNTFIDKHGDDNSYMCSDLLDVRLSVNDNKCDFSIVDVGWNEEKEDEQEHVIAKQHIPFTDLPNGEYKLFLCKQYQENGSFVYVLFLTSEY